MPRKKTEILPIDIPQDSPLMLRELAQYFGHHYIRSLESAEQDTTHFPLLNGHYQQVYILHYLVRKEVHSKHKLPAIPKSDTRYLKSAATLHLHIFNALKNGFALGLFSPEYKATYMGEPLLAWGALLAEGMFLGNCYGAKTKTEFVRFTQGTNRIMGSLDDPEDNPFPARSHTHAFLREAKKAAAESDQFNANHFRPIILERQKLAQIIRQSGGLVLDDGTIIEGKNRYKLPPQKKCS